MKKRIRISQKDITSGQIEEFVFDEEAKEKAVRKFSQIASFLRYDVTIHYEQQAFICSFIGVHDFDGRYFYSMTEIEHLINKNGWCIGSLAMVWREIPMPIEWFKREE